MPHISVLEGPTINTIQKTETTHPESLEANGFDSFFEAINAGVEFPSPEAKDLARSEAMDRELSFITKVTGAAHEMAERHGGPIVMLFDVDESLRHVDYEGSAFSLVRPAFLVSVKEMQDQLGERLELGLLTTRPQSSLDQELSSPMLLVGIEGSINPTFLISSRSAELNSPWLQYLQKCEDKGDTESLIGSVGQIVSPEFRDQLRNGGITSNYWFDLKMAILDHLVEVNPDKAFVVVDDQPYVEAIDPNSSRVMGVSVSNDIHDDTRRDAAMGVSIN